MSFTPFALPDQTPQELTAPFLCLPCPQPLLRQGQTAVRTYHELEVATTEYEPDGMVMGREALRHGALRPLGVRVALRGHLHLCLANIGENPLLMLPKGSGGAHSVCRAVPG